MLVSSGQALLICAFLAVLQFSASPRFHECVFSARSEADLTPVNHRGASSKYIPTVSNVPDISAILDAFTLPSSSKRPLGSDRSAQPIVVATVPSKRSSTVHALYDSDLHLLSDRRNITAVDGYTLYALPISLPQLLGLLLETHHDLSTSHRQTDETDRYQYSYTSWSFEVAVANGTLRYSLIASVVRRFLQLMQGQHPSKIIWTRVAVLYKGDQPFANIAIVPFVTDQESYITDLGRPEIPLVASTTPVQIMTVSPSGVTNSTEVISPHALDMYSNSLAPTLPKRQASSMEREMIVRVLNAALYVSLRILREPDGTVINAIAGLVATSIVAALGRLALGLLGELVFGSYTSGILGEMYHLDSGSYRLGQLSARFIMRTTARDRRGKPIGFAAKTWDALARALWRPLQSVPQNKEMYAVGGEIMGVDPVNGTGRRVKLGEWQLRVGEGHLGA
ncbi:MAG: hypothetical protein Q9201_006250 [Fulgogasparrea decipioides]